MMSTATRERSPEPGEGPSIYDHRLVGYGYDLLARATFGLVGGVDRLREAALDAADLRPGMGVLELGCGTGGITRKLLGRGVRVTSVDRAEPMLRRARERAPGAVFEASEITRYAPRHRYDRVIFAFVLHELGPEARRRALEIARDALAPGGAVVILDHATPAEGLVPRAASAFVHAFEPPTVVVWARGSWDEELAAAGLTMGERRTLARGMAAVAVARRGPS
jgi:SAM-dependent methyltransferase